MSAKIQPVTFILVLIFAGLLVVSYASDPAFSESGFVICKGDTANPDMAESVSDTMVVSGDSLNVPQYLSGYDFKDLRIEVSLRWRELYVVDEGEIVADYPVAIGRPEWPTRRGHWRIHMVVWNPWWHPPDQQGAHRYPIMAPGDPDNPMGRAQLIYDAPRSIHGTNNPGSIGRAVSHGSIRLQNEVAMKLARLLMEYSGIERDESWYESIRKDRNTNVRFRLEKPVPIMVY